MTDKKQEVIEIIKGMTVLELSELVKEMEEIFGVSAAAPVAVAAVGGAPAEAAKVEEKTEFDVILVAGGANKIPVIKEVRGIKKDLGLKEAKDLVDNAPQKLAEGVSKEEAEAIKAKMVAVGAEIDIR